MSTNLNIRRTTDSKLSSVDFNNIPFGKVFSDHMFEADFDGEKWTNFQIKPLENLSIHPGNLAWHYGQSIFEGMKATKSIDGEPLLFRPEKHIQRLNASARRMCMPEFPAEVFDDAIHTLVALEKDWIPSTDGSALYIRPVMMAMDEALGVRASLTYKLLIFCLPVGPYYSKPVSLKAETKYVRAAEGGVGEAKTAGNYAASLYPAKLAIEAGYDQIMWMDAKEFKYVQEVGTMNIFFAFEDKIVTPAAGGTILRGITRDTIITILRSKGYTVEERPLHIDEIVEAYKEGKLKEVFGTGTAAVVSFVRKIAYQDIEMNFNVDDYNICKLAKSTIEGLRNLSIKDENDWVVPVRALEPVL